MTPNGASAAPPRNPQEFAWLVDDFARSTPGVVHALIVSSDGLALIASGGMSADTADPLSAMSSGMLSLGNNIAALMGRNTCDQIMLKFARGHFLFMNISPLAGLAVLTEEGSNLSVIAFQMAQLVDSVGHMLTPQVRDDLRRAAARTTPRG